MPVDWHHFCWTALGCGGQWRQINDDVVPPRVMRGFGYECRDGDYLQSFPPTVYGVHNWNADDKRWLIYSFMPATSSSSLTTSACSRGPREKFKSENILHTNDSHKKVGKRRQRTRSREILQKFLPGRIRTEIRGCLGKFSVLSGVLAKINWRRRSKLEMSTCVVVRLPSSDDAGRRYVSEWSNSKSLSYFKTCSQISVRFGIALAMNALATWLKTVHFIWHEEAHYIVILRDTKL